jgi:prepilin-type N-terminal cleavage/methylation domain-containing protein
MSRNSSPAFTLAEVLIALAILGIIATFTIPKVLQAQQDTTWKAQAKDTAAALSTAFQQLKLQGSLSASTTPGDLTPYLNYLKIATTGSIDHTGGTGAVACGATTPCIRLHSGSVLYYDFTNNFGGTATTNYIYYIYDPDGQYTTGTTHSIAFDVYYDGHIDDGPHRRPGAETTLSGSVQTWGPAAASTWFDWN